MPTYALHQSATTLMPMLLTRECHHTFFAIITRHAMPPRQPYAYAIFAAARYAINAAALRS